MHMHIHTHTNMHMHINTHTLHTHKNTYTSSPTLIMFRPMSMRLLTSVSSGACMMMTVEPAMHRKQPILPCRLRDSPSTRDDSTALDQMGRKRWSNPHRQALQMSRHTTPKYSFVGCKKFKQKLIFNCGGGVHSYSVYRKLNFSLSTPALVE